MHKQQYSIGEMSRLCNVSKKALRYYDKIGLISSLRHDYNNYRMYTRDELLMAPVLKYYKQFDGDIKSAIINIHFMDAGAQKPESLFA